MLVEDRRSREAEFVEERRRRERELAAEREAREREVSQQMETMRRQMEPPLPKNTKHTRTVKSGEKKRMLSLGPRPLDIQIYVLASDGIGQAIIRICSDFGTSI